MTTPQDNIPLTTSRGLDSEMLAIVLDDIKDYAVFKVTLDGKIASWNTGAERMKLYTADEAIGMLFENLFTDEDRASGKPSRQMEHALRTGVFSATEVRLRKGHKPFDADVTLRRMDGPDGKPVGFVKVTRDVTDRVKAEKELNARMEFQETMMGIASHDLRSPLQTIMLASAMLLRAGTLTVRQTHTVSQIVSAAERAMRLVRDLLDFTQSQLLGRLPMTRSVTEADTTMREILDELRLAHPDMDITLHGGWNGEVEWDADRVSQVVTNLVSNAVKHGDPSAGVNVRLSEEQGELVFAVHNVGTPIDPELMPELFDRPSRGNRKKGGTPGSIGLGLFISSEIVRAHHGRIEARSSADAGTTLTVRLPRRSPPGEASAPRE